ncbi:hypothetical protein NE579_07400 [Intestinimonas massiliensis]|uniref:DUF7768 domain-containing protein n=1 Tax=Intestinimonas massiliensis (ex Afouda et al. 2020) TaxID=1673721 RepID=A0AAW5JN74_9FIRM|nr:DUF4406 domain-containing protein [Intestinimonas massiliensis (ex Afouda et al. 2020)]MCQ4770287.1 hypothetical protein [Intestinimonas massiliensis (ex Afouda et al. 2020)]
MMKRVYICAPLGGNVPENLRRARRYTEYALRCGVAPVTPHFYALCLDDDKPEERELGLAAGRSLLWMCDELWVFGSHVSAGMQVEINFCKSLNLPVRTVKDNEIQRKIGGYAP